MKSFLPAIGFAVVLVLPSQAQVTREQLEKEIRKLAPEPEWIVVRDHESLTLIRKGARIAANVELGPPKWLAETDYKITIKIGPPMSDEEYAGIFRFRAGLEQERVKAAEAEAKAAGAMFGDRNRWEEQKKVRSLIRLPMFRIDGAKTVYLESTYENMKVDPKSTREVREEILALLEKNCTAFPTQDKR